MFSRHLLDISLYTRITIIILFFICIFMLFLKIFTMYFKKYIEKIMAHSLNN
jgi:hypothetical protein